MKPTLPVDAIYDLGIPHNKYALPLPDGTYYPEFGQKKDARPIEFLTHFNRVRDKDWADCTLMDLGCSEGSTTFGLSQMDCTVYGVEGRADGVKRANVLRDVLGFDKTHFAVGNVDAESSFHEVDGIFNAGVLYHLEDPIRQLERCAKYARHFVYVDTGHVPRSPEEHQNSKFLRNFGKTFKIEWRGLSVDGMDVSEPKDTAEKTDGLRRKPRSGIGNTNSVWLSHRSVVDIMSELGFPYHETVSDVPLIPRLRTCFYRTAPAPLKDLGRLLRPLYRAEQHEAIQNAKRRDIAYLQRQGRPVILLGREPHLTHVGADLRSNDIAVSEVVRIPGEPGQPFAFKAIQELLGDKSGYLVAAVSEVIQLSRPLVLLDRFDYLFVSFAMAVRQSVPA